jgi:hypothetical protein
MPPTCTSGVVKQVRDGGVDLANASHKVRVVDGLGVVADVGNEQLELLQVLAEDVDAVVYEVVAGRAICYTHAHGDLITALWYYYH